jgi:hypothetical protein
MVVWLGLFAVAREDVKMMFCESLKELERESARSRIDLCTLFNVNGGWKQVVAAAGEA